MKGRRIALSAPRRLIVEHCRLALGVPRGALVGTLDLAQLAAARAAAPSRPPWTAIFAKAQALAALDVPELRRIYVKLPWPHLYELPSSVAAIVVERDVGGEPALFYARAKSPETMPLLDIGARIQAAKTAPLSELREFRLALAVARLPMPLARLLIWMGRNLGRQAPNRFGTFGVSTAGGTGMTFTIAVSHWTSFLTYGPIGADGRVETHLTFDHRAMDGGHAAAAFAALRVALLGPVLDELRALGQARPNGGD